MVMRRVAATVALAAGATADCRGNAEGTCLSPALGGKCQPPQYAYSKVLPVRVRQQWDDSDGYCGSLATQSILLTHGAWVSQDHVRRAVPGSGARGAEIYYANLPSALDTLKFEHDDWDWKGQPQPQWKNYLQWMKQHIVAGHGVVWEISDKSAAERRNVTADQRRGEAGPAFGHIEPVFGMYSKYPLNHTTYHGDDVLEHGSDYCAGAHVEGPHNYREFDTVADDERLDGNCAHAQGTIGQYPCIMKDQDLGNAIVGPVERTRSVPASLQVDRFDEPDNNKMNLRSPARLHGTLTVAGPLTGGANYTVLRWDDYARVPTDAEYVTDPSYDYAYPFTALAETHEFADPNTFLSSGTTYYRVVEGSAPAVEARWHCDTSQRCVQQRAGHSTRAKCEAACGA